MSKELMSQNSKELIEKLGDRWGVGKATIYRRLEFLGIAIAKADGKSFLNSNDLVQLDQLNEWMSTGNTLDSFPKPGALVQSEAGAIDQHTIELEAVEEGHQVRQLVRTAQEKATGVLIAQNMLTLQFMQNPDALDPDLQAQLRTTEEAIAPKSINPLQYASSLVNKFTNQSQTRAA
jgi:hypothetical protein